LQKNENVKLYAISVDPPDVSKEFAAKLAAADSTREGVGSMHVGGPSQLFLIAFAVIVAIWILSGFYQVGVIGSVLGQEDGSFGCNHERRSRWNDCATPADKMAVVGGASRSGERLLLSQ